MPFRLSDFGLRSSFGNRQSAIGNSRAFHHTVACLLLVGLTLGVFSNALRAQFVSFDDWFLIEENERIRSLSPRSIWVMLRSKHPKSHAWLPLRELSYALDYHFWGLVPTGYHLTNVLLHAANATLCYALLNWLLRRDRVARVAQPPPAEPSQAVAPVPHSQPAQPRAAVPHYWLALLGAAAFAVHPCQVESVTWASGRRDVLYAFFFLLSFLSFVAHERRTGRSRWVLYALSLMCLLFSLLSKASAMTLPAVLGLAVFAVGEREERLWHRLLATVPHWVLAVGLTAAHTGIAARAGVVKGQAFSASLANVPFIFAKYFRLLFFPVHLAVPHGDRGLRWASDGPLIGLLAAVVAGVVVAAWWAAPRRSTALFCIGWWFLLLLPVANLVPISVLTAERYLYLPLLGACGLGAEIVGGLMATRWRKGVALCSSVAVVALLAIGAHARNRAWENSRSFWQDGASKWPNIPVMRIGLATAYADGNDLERTWEQYMAVALAGRWAASTDPEHVRLVNTGLRKHYEALARGRERRGDKAAALEVYETMVRLLPKALDVRLRLALAYERMGEHSRAREQAEAAGVLLGGVLEAARLFPEGAGGPRE